MGKCSVSAIGYSLSISGGRRNHVWMLGNDFLHVLKMFRRKKNKWKESLCFAQIQIMFDTFPPIITCSCINRYKISCLKSLIYFSNCLHIHIKKWSNSRNKKYIQSILSLSIIEFSGLYTSICPKFAIIVSKLVFMNGNIANICRWLCKLDCTNTCIV